MRRDKGVKRARGNVDEGAGNDPCGDQNRIIPYKVDWTEEWPTKEEPPGRTKRIVSADTDEWEIWKYDNPTQSGEIAHSANYEKQSGK